MHPETVYLIISIIVGLGTLLTLLLGMARFIGKIDRNSDATERLTQAFEKSGNMLLDHERRITRIETRLDYVNE